MSKFYRLRKKTAVLFLSLTMAAAPVQYVSAAQSVTVEKTTAVKNGWQKSKAGYCYYENGKKLTNQWKTIGKNKYYLGADGVRKTGWYSIKNKSYYFDSKGILKKSKKMDKKLLHEMDKVIKKQKITSSTSNKDALKKLFNYCSGSDFGYARAIGFKGQKGWEYNYAKQMLLSKKGSCYHYSAVFAFLAKRATGCPVRICWGKSNAFNTAKWQYHAWVEIKLGNTWYTYDPNAAKYSSLRKGKWYQQKRSAMEGKIYKTKEYVNVEL